jgi:hypothetical protein
MIFIKSENDAVLSADFIYLILFKDTILACTLWSQAYSLLLEK